MMKRPVSFSPPRPFRVASRVPRSRTEAAGELVRVEFERARLERDLDQMQHRMDLALRSLEEMEGRAGRLIGLLDEAPRKDGGTP